MRSERARWEEVYNSTSFTPPKKVTTWRTCPGCGSKATKLFMISRPNYNLTCQICGFCYDPPGKDRDPGSDESERLRQSTRRFGL